jgi:4a-hydroxytetrahydrobiopterin dehydratase
MALLSEDRIDEGLRGTPWRREGGAVVLDRAFADFRAAMTWVDAVAELAERANHHPDILVHDYNEVRLTLSTHSEGGITEADVELAADIAALGG